MFFGKLFQVLGLSVRSFAYAGLVLALMASLLVKPTEAAFVNPAPVVINLEDFQNVSPTGVTHDLADYVGSGGNTYTADPYWLDENYCNGIITQYGASNINCVNSNSVGDYADRNIQRMAHVLGQVHGMGDPTGNYAVSAWTTAPNFDVDPPLNAVEFQTLNPYNINVAGRFVNISVDVAEASCEYLGGVNNSSLMFYALDSGVEHPLTDNPIVPCTDSRATVYDAPALPGGGWGDGGNGVKAGRFFGDRSYLFSGSSLGVMMRNQTDRHLGNDHAWDNIYFLDTTPTLLKEFSQPEVGSRESRLVFTILNTSELSAKRGWSFTDILSQGLSLASTPNVQTDCLNSTVNAAGSEISLTGDLEVGQQYCQLEVSVVAQNGGTYQNCPTNFTQHVGLNLPECASVTFGTVVDPTSGTEVNSAQADVLASTGANTAWAGLLGLVLIVAGSLGWFGPRVSRT